MANTPDRLRKGRSESEGDDAGEQMKRKREMLGRDSLEGELKLADIFKKSNRTARSPLRKEGDGDWKEMFKEMREEIREGLKGVRQDIREVAETQKEAMRKEMERIKEELRKREEVWNKEKKELKERIERMEQELKGFKMGEEKRERDGEEEEKREGGRRRIGGEEENWRERVRKLERRCEIRERGERKRNLLIRGLKEGKEGMREEVERVMKRIGVEVKVKEIRRIETGRKEIGSRAIVRVESEDEKTRIMQNKWKLKGGELWIEDDLTWEERRIKWKLTQIARIEEERGEE